MALSQQELRGIASDNQLNDEVKPTTTWVAILPRMKWITALGPEDIDFQDFIWFKCHPRITVRTLRYRYFELMPLDEFVLFQGNTLLDDDTMVKDLKYANTANVCGEREPVVLLAVVKDDAKEENEFRVDEKMAARIRSELEQPNGTGNSTHRNSWKKPPVYTLDKTDPVELESDDGDGDDDHHASSSDKEENNKKDDDQMLATVQDDSDKSSIISPAKDLLSSSDEAKAHEKDDTGKLTTSQDDKEKFSTSPDDGNQKSSPNSSHESKDRSTSSLFTSSSPTSTTQDTSENTGKVVSSPSPGAKNESALPTTLTEDPAEEDTAAVSQYDHKTSDEGLATAHLESEVEKAHAAAEEGKVANTNDKIDIHNDEATLEASNKYISDKENDAKTSGNPEAVDVHEKPEQVNAVNIGTHDAKHEEELSIFSEKDWKVYHDRLNQLEKATKAQVTNYQVHNCGTCMKKLCVQPYTRFAENGSPMCTSCIKADLKAKGELEATRYYHCELGTLSAQVDLLRDAKIQRALTGLPVNMDEDASLHFFHPIWIPDKVDEKDWAHIHEDRKAREASPKYEKERKELELKVHPAIARILSEMEAYPETETSNNTKSSSKRKHDEDEEEEQIDDNAFATFEKRRASKQPKIWMEEPATETSPTPKATISQNPVTKTSKRKHDEDEQAGDDGFPTLDRPRASKQPKIWTEEPATETDPTPKAAINPDPVAKTSKRKHDDEDTETSKEDGERPSKSAKTEEQHNSAGVADEPPTPVSSPKRKRGEDDDASDGSGPAEESMGDGGRPFKKPRLQRSPATTTTTSGLPPPSRAGSPAAAAGPEEREAAEEEEQIQGLRPLDGPSPVPGLDPSLLLGVSPALLGFASEFAAAASDGDDDEDL